MSAVIRFYQYYFDPMFYHRGFIIYYWMQFIFTTVLESVKINCIK